MLSNPDSLKFREESEFPGQKLTHRPSNSPLSSDTQKNEKKNSSKKQQKQSKTNPQTSQKKSVNFEQPPPTNLDHSNPLQSLESPSDLSEITSCKENHLCPSQHSHSEDTLGSHSHAHGHHCEKHGLSPMQQAQQRIQNFFIGKFKEAPEFVADNKYILSGYRINFTTSKNAFKSMFMVHNELVNVWTHAIGALLVIILLIYVAVQTYGMVDLHESRETLMENINNHWQPIYQEFISFDQKLNDQVSKGVYWIKNEFQQNNNYNHVISDQQFPTTINNNHNDNENDNANANSNSKANQQQDLDNHQAAYTVHQQFNNFLNEMVELKDKNIDKFMEKLKSLPEHFEQYSKFLENNYAKEKWVALKGKLDSPDFDWIDGLWTNYQEIQNDHKNSQHQVSRWPIFVFLVTAVLCLGFSAVFHLYYCVSPKLYKILLRLDYSGVSLLISGSTMPIFYYGFYCYPTLSAIYISSIAIACTVVFVVSLQDFIHTQPYFLIKSIMYGSLGILSGVPIVHLIYIECFSAGNQDAYSTLPSITYYIFMGICYLGGLTLYALRCPERVSPGKFDICGASHQLWHMSILLAIFLTYIGSVINFHTRKQYECPVV